MEELTDTATLSVYGTDDRHCYCQYMVQLTDTATVNIWYS